MAYKTFETFVYHLNSEHYVLVPSGKTENLFLISDWNTQGDFPTFLKCFANFTKTNTNLTKF